jgi:sulfur-oxidizing protein SoxZ
MARAIVSVPARAKKGQIIEIKALVGHVMETGFRHAESGATISRDIIRLFVCRYNGEEIFRAEFHPAVAANPLIEFSTIAIESGKLEFTWTGDNQFSATETAAIAVE